MNSHDFSLVDKSPERIRRMFSAIAPRYDFINHVLTLGIDSLWRKFTAQQLFHEQTVDGDVLDVCCGTGEQSLAFWKRQSKLGMKRMNYGIDFTPEMVEVAQKKVSHLADQTRANYQPDPTCLNEGTGFHFSVGDALELPFEEARFAVVAVAFGLRNVGDTQRGLTEMVRVCKPGGTVAVLDFSMPTLPVLRQCYWFYFHTILPKLGKWLGKDRNQAYTYLPKSVLQFDSPKRLAERLTQFGIVDIQTQPMTFGIVSLVWGQKSSKKC